MEKFKLLDKSIIVNGRCVYQIQALVDFGNVEKDEIGGYVESEHNLSQAGNCWIYDDAVVMNNAIVMNDAIVRDKAIISDNACISDKAIVEDYATITGNAIIYGRAHIEGHSQIKDCACVSGIVGDNSTICQHATIHDDVTVRDNAYITAEANIVGDISIAGDAQIKENSDYIVIQRWWSKDNDFIAWTKSNNRYNYYGESLTGQEFFELYEENEINSKFKDVAKYINLMRMGLSKEIILPVDKENDNNENQKENEDKN